MPDNPSIRAPVTVIIPCYHCSGTITRAVNSVVVQTLRPARLILIDDGSDDATLQQLRALQAQHGSDWISVIALAQNCGASVARNAGWEAATQPLIAFLDADDAWHPDKIKIQYGWMKAHPEAEMTGHLYAWIRNSRSQPPALMEKLQITRLSPRKLLYSSFPTPGAMLRRELPFRFAADKRRSEDKLLWMQIVLSGIPCYRLEMPLVYLFKAPEGAGGLSGNRVAMWRAHLDTIWRLNRSSQLSNALFIENAVRSTLYTFIKFPLTKLFSRRRNG